MKIVVGIPSLNEADSITYVAEHLNNGVPPLQARFTEAEVVLVNVDSSSSDDTVDKFLSAIVTHASREVVIVPGQPGKGKNLLALFRLAITRGATAVVTVDADITSITAEWLSLLVSPVLERTADLVVPQYARSRYEGSTTNHFAFPLVSSVAGFPVRQPIGGDFAMSMKLAHEMLASPTPLNGERYGIDIWLSLTAALMTGKISSVDLGKKLHKPSFDKLIVMFPQIASCALSFLKERRWHPSMTEPIRLGLEKSITADTFFRHESSARDMLTGAFDSIRDKMRQKPLWISADFMREINERISGNNTLSPKLWAQLLSNWIIFGLREESDSVVIARELLPFFVWHAVSFWFESRTMNEQEIEQYLIDQAVIFHTSLLRTYATEM